MATTAAVRARSRARRPVGPPPPRPAGAVAVPVPVPPETRDASPSLLTGVVRAVMVAIVVIDALAELEFLRKRLRWRLSSWWGGIERSERHRLHIAELRFLDSLTRRPPVA